MKGDKPTFVDIKSILIPKVWEYYGELYNRFETDEKFN